MRTDEIEIKNAKITATSLGLEDHGIFTANLCLEFDGGGCWFGGWALDDKPVEPMAKGEAGRRRGTAYGLDAIMLLLRVLGVSKWEDVKGQFVRARLVGGWGGKVEAVGHLMRDDWFTFDDERILGAAELRARKATRA
jgi:hypothetical protein